VIILDLDAHQGNGHERDFTGDPETYIIDFYNHYIYPEDTRAARVIRDDINVTSGDSDDAYTKKVRETLTAALDSFQPCSELTPHTAFLLYNAGTDCMQNDPLGRMNLSPDAIVARDQIVFELCLRREIPVLMVLSGGYQKINAPTIARSIKNLL
jgi:histone deacetylase 11